MFTIPREIILLILILLLATFLRIFVSLDQPINRDEAKYINIVTEILEGKKSFYEPVTKVNGPVLNYILILSMFLFGKDIFFLRLPFILISIVSVFLLYLFTKKYYDKNTALLSSLFLAIAPNEILNNSVVFEILLIPFFY